MHQAWCVVCQTNMLQSWERIVLLAPDATGLEQIGSVLQWDCIQFWTSASGIIHVFSNRPFKFIVWIRTNCTFFLATNQRIVTLLCCSSAVIKSKYDDPSRPSQICRYAKVFNWFTVNLTATIVREWKSTNKLSRKMIQGSPRTVEIRSATPSIARLTEMSSYTDCPSSRTYGTDTLVG